MPRRRPQRAPGGRSPGFIGARLWYCRYQRAMERGVLVVSTALHACEFQELLQNTEPTSSQLESPMNFQCLHRSNLLVMHPDPILSAGLVAALRQHDEFEVFVHGVDNLGSDGPRVDVVIADYNSAMRLAEDTSRKPPGLPGEAKILVLTANDREVDIRRAIEAGVYGYLLVGGSVDELIAGAKSVAGGLRYMSMSVAQRMADSLTRATLTSREIEVLRLLVNGHPNKVIARELSIELGTVKSHVSTIMTKLGASSRTQAARIAASRGLVDEPVHAERDRSPQRARPIEARLQFA